MTDTADESSTEGELILAPVREGETVAGKYVVGPVLGVGGMGVVVLGHDKLLDRKVAIKFLLPRLASSERAVQRFVREARAATRITSEHVVTLLEIDKLPTGMPFLVMEYLEGRDLRAVTSELGGLPFGRAVDYVLQALQAVAEGHLKGIVHRDLKPSNLFMTYRADGTPLIKVLDFGIAKTLQSDDHGEFTLTGSEDVRLGSPAYMPPEQLKSPSEVDARSDIWALGVTLYELVSGHQPFVGRTYSDLVLAIATAAPAALNKRRPGMAIPKGLEQVILRCLEKERSQRHANAVELATALAPFGSDDARASLRRIQGLGAPGESATVCISKTPPVPARATCSTTLPAAARPEGLRARRSGVRVVGVRYRQLASWIGGVAVVLALVGALVWRASETARKDSIRAAPTSHVDRSRRASPPAALPPPAASPPRPSLAVESARRPTPESQGQRHATPRIDPRHRAGARPSATRPMEPPDAAAPPASAAAENVENVENAARAAGRLPEIERLIERRR